MANFAEVLKELEQERSRLDQAIRAIGELVGRNRTGVIQPRANRPRRTLSAAARRATAQRARWAKTKRAEASTPVRTMSQSARKKIAAAQRARWAKVRAQQKKAA
jgi:hypothetical protein